MKITVLGAGLLGSALVERLLGLKYDVTVYNRTVGKTKALSAKGAHVASTVQNAVEYSDCIILMLADYKAIEDVLLNNTITDFKGKTIIQMGTAAPAESKMLLHRINNLNGEYFECPVLGSRKEALAGNLILMAGSTKEQFDQWRGLLNGFGPKPRRIGAVGQASAMKLALNNLIAAHAICFSLSLGIIEKSGCGVEEFMAILRESALYSPMYDKKMSNWMKKDYSNPNFPVKHLLKDVKLILNEARGNGLNTDVVEVFARILQQSINQGLGEQDYSAVFNTVNKIS